MMTFKSQGSTSLDKLLPQALNLFRKSSALLRMAHKNLYEFSPAELRVF